MFCACTETTGRVLFARRQAFRVELEGRLGGLDDPGALAAAATRMLGPWLQTAQVSYMEVAADGALGTVTQNWNEPRMPDLLGRRFQLHDLGPALIRDLLHGRVVAIEDLAADPRTERRGRAVLRRVSGWRPSSLYRWCRPAGRRPCCWCSTTRRATGPRRRWTSPARSPDGPATQPNAVGRRAR